jgi:uncharacterized protein with FMN-binding domain
VSVRRGPFAVAAATAGFFGALGFHVSGSNAPLAPAAIVPRGGQSASVITNPTKKAGSGATVQHRPVTTTTGVPNVNQSATGTTEQYGYGQLAVRVTASGAKITGLSLVGLQTAESYSQQIADQVIPLLRNEVLAAQSVQVNGYSGATYTTEAYLSSIQSALDKLHVK